MSRSLKSLRSVRWAAVLALVAGAAGAQNLYPNGDFNDAEQIAGWGAAVGTVEHQAPDVFACPASGSLAGIGDDNPPLPSFLDANGPCLPWLEGGTAYVQFEYQGAGSPAPGDVTFALRAFGNPDCELVPTGSTSVTVIELFPWAHFEGTLQVPVDGSVQMRLSGGCTFTCDAQIDQIRVTRQPLVFLDDFEGGGVCRWSSSVV